MRTPFAPSRPAAARLKSILLGSAAILLCSGMMAKAGNTWDGGGGDDNWGTPNNWNPDGTPGYGTLTFSGSTRTTNINNSITAMNILMWTGASAWTLNNSGGTVLSLFDNGGGQAKVENQSSGLVTINAPITFAANNGSPPNPFGEINAVNGNITFGSGTLTVNGSSVNGIKMFGSGRTTTFNNTVSASGKWFGTTGNNTTVAVGGAFTSGDVYVMNGGTLKLNSGGSITTTGVRLGGDFGNTGQQNQALGGTFQLTNAGGSQSFGGTINSVTGNTSNALVIDSQNTSGTNTLTGGIFLDSDLKIQQAGGALTTSTGTFDVKARKLTVDSAGTVTVSQPLSSSLGAGGNLVKQGAGTLILSNTSNSYSGTNNATLNANSTQIAGGTLGIHGDGSLGVVPGGAYNNVQFTASGTLQDTANNVSVHANRNISVASGATGTFDNNGNTFTINGVVNGSGGHVASTGAGTTILTGNNSHTGTTSVTQGTLQVNVNNALGTNAAGTTVSNGAALKLNNVNYSTTEALSITGSGISGGGALVNSGTSTYAGQITAAGPATIHTGGGTLNITGGVVKNGVGLTLTGGGQVNFSGTSISGASAGSDLIVDGTTANLNLANTYNGPTSLLNGSAVNANVAGALPTGSPTDLALDSTGTGGSSLTLLTDQVAKTLAAAANSTINVNDNTLSLSTGLTLSGTGASPTVLAFDLDTPVTSGLIDLTGGVFTGPGGTGAIKISLAGPTAGPGTYKLIDWADGGASGVDLGDFFLDPANLLGSPVDNYVLQINGSELDLVAAVPEPANLAAPLAGLLGMLAIRRRVRRG